MPLIKLSSIESVSKNVLISSGVPEGDAQIISDSIIYAHCRGKGTHGITRLPIYVRKIQNGLMSADTKMTIVKNSPIITIVDAAHGFGQVAGYKGMKRCIEKASQYGIGVVGIRNSNNFATAGFLAEMATENKMIGLVFGNSAPAIAPWGGNKPILGTNPMGMAFPTRQDKAPVSLDMATSFAARGKIRLAAKNNEKIPYGWALDEYGQPTDNPLEALKGSMIPIGEHKGYGLSLAIDILAGLLPGAAFGGDVKPLNDQEGYSNYGHLLLAINVIFFTDYDEYLEKMNTLEEKVKQGGQEGSIFLPGEKSWLHAQGISDAVNIAPKQVEEINKLAEDIGIEYRLD